MSELTELIRELVAIPSHDDATATGDRIVQWLQDQTDATVYRDDAPSGGNIIARRGTGEQTLAFVGHHDVVPPAPDQQATEGRYRVWREDDRLYGRGTADMLGGVAAGLLAFRDASPKTEIIFASFVGEEAGGIGAQHAIKHGFAPTYAIIGEGSAGYTTPGVVDVVVAHKGRQGSTITIEGEATHASVPETGTNAIYRACEIIDQLRSVTPSTYTIADETLAGTMAVTQVTGGTAWNQVPATCELTVDERTVPEGTSVLTEVQTHPAATVTVEQELPPMACSHTAFAHQVQTAADRAQDGVPAQTVKPHATDAGWLADAGTACVVCGPAEVGEAHTATESVSVPIVEQCYRTYRAALSMAPPEAGD